MDLIVSLEHRFQRTPDGCVWTQVAFAEGFWGRYLEVFDRVFVLARVIDVPTRASGWVRASSGRIDFIAVPYYVGPGAYLKRVWQVRNAVRQAAQLQAAVIMRVPSFIATHLTPVLYATGRPFGVEVVGDPWDAFSPVANNHPLRPFLRQWLSRHLRMQCARATAAAYVTEKVLQRRYPCGAYTVGVSDISWPTDDVVVQHGILATHFSSIEIEDPSCPPAQAVRDCKAKVRLVTVAALQQPYKGVGDLISAVASCLRQGLSLDLTIVGDGRLRPSLEQHAARMGIREQVHFAGQVTAGEAVYRHLDASDIFVLASLTEGLPRAMIEAMGRGLPCIGSTVGGIPELLPERDMFPPGDIPALAAKIFEIARDPERRLEMARTNLARARGFRESVLRTHRMAFYIHLDEATKQWFAGGSSQQKNRSRFATDRPL
jgi:glycosyltransferase involved in cell wall biosynthesis